MSNNAPALLRSLIIYAICVPLAIIMGYLLTNPMDYATMGLFSVLMLLLILPVLLRWHYPLLLLSWNMGITLFFLPGQPGLWLVMVLLSLGISLLERALNSQMQFIRVPQITWPLLCLAGVVFLTAKFTGGIGLRSLGSGVYGGKKYVFLLAAILSYFALTSRRVPPERAGLYVALFFLGGMVNVIGDLFSLAPSWAHFIFWLFPVNPTTFHRFELGETRLQGFSGTGFLLWCFLMARCGIRGIFLSGKPGRLFIFFFCLVLIFLGGFRYQLALVGAIFIFQFFAEGLHRTGLLPVLAWVGIIAMTALVPLASKLPFTFQRTLAFLPLNLDPAAKADAQATAEWRFKIWQALLPQVPKYLLLGKGMAIPTEEYNEMMTGTILGRAGGFDPSQEPLALSYDYHNGPLSVIIPFGIWGCTVVLWFFVAGFQVVHSNFRSGDPWLRSINTFFFVYYLVSVIQFLFVGGALCLDLSKFAGIVGLSIALNGGVCQRVPRPITTGEAFLRPRGALPSSQPRPAFPQ